MHHCVVGPGIFVMDFNTVALFEFCLAGKTAACLFPCLQQCTCLVSSLPPPAALSSPVLSVHPFYSLHSMSQEILSWRQFKITEVTVFPKEILSLPGNSVAHTKHAFGVSNVYMFEKSHT